MCSDVAQRQSVDLLLDVIRTESGRDKAKLEWTAGRLGVLKAKADAVKIADFEKSCARGQLAAAQGDFPQAIQELTDTLGKYRSLYPWNGHLFTHILQLALALHLTEGVSLMLNDRHKTPDLFRVALGPDTGDFDIHRVTVDEFGLCHYPVHPRIALVPHADYFIGHWQGSLPLWAAFCRSSLWEPGSILVNSGEAGRRPGLAFCGNRPEHILVPDNYFSSSGYADLRSRYDAARPAWEDRTAVAFWRGATTGIRTGQREWQSLPRIDLCLLARANDADIDAGISDVVQCSEQDRQAIHSADLVKGRVPAEEYLKYKYQIDIDGNSNAWSGLFQRLFTGSPVLKVASPHGYRQWYYDRLKPWINFVPIKTDMSDLVAAIHWLRDHDDDARAIGEAGLKLARSLDRESELAFSNEQIRAAFRSQRGAPERFCRYGAGGEDGKTLTDGWDVGRADDLVWALGSHSVVKLPALAMSGDYEINIDLEPHIHDPDVPAQRLTFVTNGVVAAECSLSSRRNFCFTVSIKAMSGRDAIEIVILHPDGFAPCLYRPKRDDRSISVAIRSLSVTRKGAADRPVVLE